MLAFVLFEGTVEAYRAQWREAAEERKQKHESGGNQFSAMKERMRAK